jgi:hypothetical protein
LIHHHLAGRRLIAPVLASVAVVAMALVLPVAAQGTDPRDLQGVWQGTLRTISKPRLRPVAQKIFDDNTEELRRKLPITKDPVLRCAPLGVPHIYNNGVHPFEILQTPARTFLFYESDRTWRTVWTDGRSMPDDVSDLWLGYSIGRWEGNELVIETEGFNDKTWILQGEGTTHSDKLHVTERVRRTGRASLQIAFTLTDPEYFEGPWTLTGDYKLQPKWELDESFCVPEEQQIFDRTVLAPNARPVK